MRPFVNRAWKNDLEVLRRVADAKLKAEPLQWWWCKHYNRPLLDPLLQTYTIEELQIENLMYQIEEDPQRAYPKEKGNIQFRTGDALIDKWETQLAEGKTDINFDEGVDKTFLDRFKEYSREVAARHMPELAAARMREVVEKLPVAKEVKDDFLATLVGGFDDDYTR